MDTPEIDVDELETRLAAGGLLFDVRESDEYVTEHIDGAQLIPLGVVAESVDQFPTDQAAYVICAKGGRSGRAVEILRAEGIDAINVGGGVGAWVEAGKPTIAGLGR